MRSVRVAARLNAWVPRSFCSPALVNAYRGIYAFFMADL